MFTILSKIAVIPFFPVGFTVVCGLLGLVLLVFNKRKVAFCAIALSVGCVSFFSFPPVSHALARSLEGKYAQLQSYPHVSAIVLLGGSEIANVSPRLFYEINGNGDRLLHAARLFKKGYAPILIASGGKPPFVNKYPIDEAHISRALLTELFNIDSNKIAMDPNARTTHDHPKGVRKILDSLKLKPEIILVTSAFHMPRSVAVFKKSGFTVYPAPANFLEDVHLPKIVLSYLPNSDALNKSTAVIHEYYGLIAYKIFGWI